jgi:hypothetical protein
MKNLQRSMFILSAPLLIYTRQLLHDPIEWFYVHLAKQQGGSFQGKLRLARTPAATNLKTS